MFLSELWWWIHRSTHAVQCIKVNVHTHKMCPVDMRNIESLKTTDIFTVCFAYKVCQRTQMCSTIAQVYNAAYSIKAEMRKICK